MTSRPIGKLPLRNHPHPHPHPHTHTHTHAHTQRDTVHKASRRSSQPTTQPIAKMASRIFSSGARALVSKSLATSGTRRTFQSSAPRLYADAAAALPARKPMGAFRGGSVSHLGLGLQALRHHGIQADLVSQTNRLFGFLLGATLAGTGSYYYILQDYKTSNELLQDDIYVRYRIRRCFKHCLACCAAISPCSGALFAPRFLPLQDVWLTQISV